MNQIPYELLHVIFDNLSLPKDKFRLALTCKQVYFYALHDLFRFLHRNTPIRRQINSMTYYCSLDKVNTGELRRNMSIRVIDGKTIVYRLYINRIHYRTSNVGCLVIIQDNQIPLWEVNACCKPIMFEQNEFLTIPDPNHFTWAEGELPQCRNITDTFIN